MSKVLLPGLPREAAPAKMPCAGVVKQMPASMLLPISDSRIWEKHLA